MIEKPPNLKAILPSALSSLTLMLNRPYLYSSYLAYSGVTSNNAQKSHDFPLTRIYSIVFHEQVNKDKVTLCKIVQTSSFYDVHTMNVLRARSELIISDDLATVSGRGVRPCPSAHISRGVSWQRWPSDWPDHPSNCGSWPSPVAHNFKGNLFGWSGNFRNLVGLVTPEIITRLYLPKKFLLVTGVVFLVLYLTRSGLIYTIFYKFL